MNRSFTRTAWLAAALAAVSLFSCQRENVPQKEQVPSGPVSIDVTIDQETRTSVSETSGAITFTEGDGIKIFNGTGVYKGITQSTESSGMFVMEDGFSAGSGYAGFPADFVTDITSGGVTFNLPTTYRYSQVGGSSANSAKVPCPMVGTYSGAGISLKPVCALVRFYLTNVAAGTLSFTFRSPVTGTATVTTPSGTNDGILQNDLGNANATITVTGVPKVEDGDVIYITIPVPVGTAPQNVVVRNASADGTADPRFALMTGIGQALERGHGHRFVNIHFVIDDPSFSVSEYQHVLFAPGNLQYIGSVSTPYFKFADHQWDYYGSTTGQDTPSVANVDRDLFAWATSGYMDKYPYYFAKSLYSVTDYGPAISSGEWTDDSEEWDWGVHNTISNGEGYSWRTPTSEEFLYLLRERTCSPRYALATVAGVKGLILFPDLYHHPSGVAAINKADTACSGYADNTFDVASWISLECVGCVFLPAAGRNGSSSVTYAGVYGHYWTSTASTTSGAKGFHFYDGGIVTFTSSSRHDAISVRLLREIN